MSVQKFIRIDEKTHLEIKLFAVENNLTIGGAIKKLIKERNKRLELLNKNKKEIKPEE